jgi:hypothetical protein
MYLLELRLQFLAKTACLRRLLFVQRCETGVHVSLARQADFAPHGSVLLKV